MANTVNQVDFVTKALTSLLTQTITGGVTYAASLQSKKDNAIGFAPAAAADYAASHVAETQDIHDDMFLAVYNALTGMQQILALDVASHITLDPSAPITTTTPLEVRASPLGGLQEVRALDPTTADALCTKRYVDFTWDTPTKTATFTASNREAYGYDPVGVGFQINLPAAPSNGDTVLLKNVTTDVTSVTINGGAFNVEDPANPGSIVSATEAASGAGLTLRYSFDGTQWLLV
jgi:hypothetical protein